MKAILERHLSSARIGAMAIMGLPANASEPWIFLSMQFVPPGLVPQLPNGGFIPVHGPTLDGRTIRSDVESVGTNPGLLLTPPTIFRRSPASTRQSRPMDRQSPNAVASRL